MTSSSSSTYFLKPHEINALTQDEDEKKAKAGEERDWLQLSLGNRFDSPSKIKTDKSSVDKSSFTTTLSPQHEQKMPLCSSLGLGLCCNVNIPAGHNQTFFSSRQDCNRPTSHVTPAALELPCRKSVPTLPFHFRPHPGIWFSLRSSIINSSREGEGGREMGLPQIPKMYIRVKDEKVTVLTVKSYLVTKLGLSNETEVEIRCNGEVVQNWEMLKDIRDTIWLPRLFESSKSTPPHNNISVLDVSSLYIMSLDYRRNSSFSNF